MHRQDIPPIKPSTVVRLQKIVISRERRIYVYFRVKDDGDTRRERTMFSWKDYTFAAATYAYHDPNIVTQTWWFSGEGDMHILNKEVQKLSLTFDHLLILLYSYFTSLYLHSQF